MRNDRKIHQQECLNKALPPGLQLPHEVREEVRAMSDEDLLVAIRCEEINSRDPEDERLPYQRGLPYKAYQEELQNESRRRGLSAVVPKGCSTCIHFSRTDPIGPGWCASLSMEMEGSQPNCEFYSPIQD